MKIKAKQNRELIMINAQNTQNENDAEKIILQVPEQYEDFNKKIVFITPDGNVWDIITNNEYLIKKAITKYKQVDFYIWLTKGDVDFRSQTKTLKFYQNVDASDEITDEEIGRVNTVVNLLEEEITKVENLESQIDGKLEEVDTAIDNIHTAIQETENLDLDAEKVGQTTTVTLTKKDGTTKTVHIDDGVDLQFMWQGTSLGIKTAEQAEYTFVNLQGAKGERGEKGEKGDTYDDTEIKNDISEINANIKANLEQIETDLNNCESVNKSQSDTIAEHTTSINANTTEITNARSSAIKNKTFASVDARLEDIEADIDNIEINRGHIFTIRRKITNNSSSAWEVLDDRKGLNVNATLNGNTSVVNELYNFSPYKDIKICDYDITSMRVNAYYGDPTFKFDGSNGDVYVFIPDTYIKEYEDNDYHYISISDVPRAGFKHYESFYISKYLIQVIDGKARSYSGLKPTTQITIANARTAATANGSRFCLLDLDAVTVIQDLFLVMFANTNCQSKCGYGVTNGFTYTALIAETSVNRMIVSDPKLLYVGKTINIGKAWWDISIAKQRDVTKIEDYKDGDISGKAIYFDGDPVNIAVGNAIWSAGQTAGQTDALGMVNGTVLNDHEHSVNLFGIENFWSNLWQFVDGVTHYKNKLFVCNDHSQYANEKMTSPYKQLNYEVCASEGWVSKMGYDVDMPEYKFPTENKASDSTYWSDYYYVNPNAKNLDAKYLALLGGSFGNGSEAGLFCWSLGGDFGWSDLSGGARVLIRNQ